MRIHPIARLGIYTALIVHLSSALGATPVLRVGFDSWVGFAGIFAAVDQGFFEKEGVKIELRSFPGPTDTIPPTIAGDLDIALTTPDNVMSVDAGQKADLITIALIDVSDGADAVVARNDIADIAGLRNKKIAVTFGQCNELLLLQALAKSGLKQSDVTLLNMDADAAGAAFIAGRLDAAVTWEPWVTQVTSSGRGRILFSSKLAPNLIFDGAAVTRKYAAGHKTEIEAFIRGMDAGVAYLRSHPNETYAIVAKALAIKPADVAQMLKGVKVLNLDENRELFGEAAKPGRIYAAMDSVADFQVAQQLYKVKPVVGTTMDAAFVRSAAAAGAVLPAAAVGAGTGVAKPVRPPAPADWFHVFPIDERTYALSEPKYWQENVSYLLIGTDRALLFDTGPGIYGIRAAVRALTSLPVIVIPSHLHFDHVGDNEEFDDVRLLDTPALRSQVRDGYFVESAAQYQLQGSIKYRVHGWIKDGATIDLGGRAVRLLSTPGHTPDSVSLVDAERRRLFTGDLVNREITLCAVPGSDIQAMADSLRRLLTQGKTGSVAYEAHAEKPLTWTELKLLANGIGDIAAGRGTSKPMCLGGTPTRRFSVGDFPVVLPLVGGPSQPPLASVTTTIDWNAGPCP